MNTLKPYASSSNNSRGRTHSEPPPNNRTEYQRDRDRIVHSAAFRRLEYKTQVFVNHEGDMFRTRLTHSIEVAQIGRTIARALNVNEDLTEAIALAHDLGHTPFGHAGQDCLNKCMKNYGGFEHNLQSLRIVDRLEERYAEFLGLNLTFETREGILKHCSSKIAAQLGSLGERFLNKKQAGIEAQIANLADEIAYNNHDVDDGLRAGLISVDQLTDIKLFAQQYELVKNLYPKITQRRVIHEVIRRMINAQITDILNASKNNIDAIRPDSRDTIINHSHPVVGYSDEMSKQTRNLKKFLRNNLYQHYKVNRMTNKANKIIQALFDAFMHDPYLLPPETLLYISNKQTENKDPARARVIADYIAGMTDRYAIEEYRKLFNVTQLY